MISPYAIMQIWKKNNAIARSAKKNNAITRDVKKKILISKLPEKNILFQYKNHPPPWFANGRPLKHCLQ